MRPHSVRAGQRGFTLVAVLAAMALVGAALVCLTALFRHEAERTRAVQAEAQLRQLLLAALPEVEEKLNAQAAVSPEDVTLAAPLEGSTMIAHIDVRGDACIAGVVATYHSFTAVESVGLSKAAGHWNVTNARLEKTGGE
jgi:type II secretory pathway component PulJ